MKLPAALALGVLFALSGATALAYQIVWVRSLSLTLGSTVLAISIVVATFMGGLALGSALFGRWVERVRSPLALYALLEAAIGACALGVWPAFAAIADRAAGGGVGGTAAFPFVASFLVLLVPTTLIGGTLPVLSAFVARHASARSAVGARIGALYAANTFGAIAGAALAGFVMIRALGMRNTTLVAAGANFLIAILSWWLARARRPPATPSSAAQATNAAPAPASSADAGLLGLVTLVFFANGLVGLALEVLWSRSIALFAANTIYAFTVILTTFLGGLALGSGVMSVLVRRVRRAAPWLGGLQCVLGLLAAATPIALAAFGVPLFRAVVRATEPLALLGEIASAYAIAAVFVLPGTLLLGASFPLVARIVAEATPRIGRAVGRVYAINTAGAVLGSLLAGFVALPLLGIERSIFAFALVSVVTGLALVHRARAPVWTAIGGASVAAIVLLLALSTNHYRGMLEQWLDARLTFYEEGVETTAAVYDSPTAHRPVLVLNSSRLDDRGVVHKMLAHLPALLHPSPQRALTLGFGVGITSQAFAVHGIGENHCVEISDAVVSAAASFAALNGNIVARGDPKFRMFVTDARRFLLRAAAPYDIIALDANSGVLRNAGIGKLYSREFFELCRARLTADGIVSLYASPNATIREFTMVARTFTEVFPHATQWVDPVYGETSVLLATAAPLRVDLARYLTRIRAPAVERDLEALDLDPPVTLLAAHAMTAPMLRHFCRDAERNTDDRPLMEFYSLQVDAFDADDRPFLDIGLPIRRESVLPYLDYGAGGAEIDRVRADLEMMRRAQPSVDDAAFFHRQRDSARARSAQAMALALWPQAEHLRAAVGLGRADYRRALERSRSGTPQDLGYAGWVARQRGAYREAAALLERAITVAGSRGRRFHVEAARAYRELGDLARARQHLAEAARLGEDVTLDALEVDLVAARRDQKPARDLLRRAAAVALTTNIVRGYELLRDLEAEGALDAELTEACGRCLEAFGDPAGARAYYERALARDSRRSGTQARLRIVELELALRADLFRAAYPGNAAALERALSSPFTGSAARAADVPERDHADAQAWLELAELYRVAGRDMDSYRKARVARFLAPTSPATYVAIGRAAGSTPTARLAFERALALDPGNKAARAALGRP